MAQLLRIKEVTGVADYGMGSVVTSNGGRSRSRGGRKEHCVFRDNNNNNINEEEDDNVDNSGKSNTIPSDETMENGTFTLYNDPGLARWVSTQRYEYGLWDVARERMEEAVMVVQTTKESEKNEETMMNYHLSQSGYHHHHHHHHHPVVKSYLTPLRRDILDWIGFPWSAESSQVRVNMYVHVVC